MLFQRILHPTDFSEHSKLALHYAGELTRERNGKLLIVHVVETLGPENITFGEAVSQRQPDAFRQRLWDQLHQVRPFLAAEVEYMLREGDTVEGIVQAAREWNCDLIVMGSHGRTGWKRLMIGSVAEAVVRRAPSPVLVIKPPLSPSQAGEKTATELHPNFLTDGNK